MLRKPWTITVSKRARPSNICGQCGAPSRLADYVLRRKDGHGVDRILYLGSALDWEELGSLLPAAVPAHKDPPTHLKKCKLALLAMAQDDIYRDGHRF